MKIPQPLQPHHIFLCGCSIISIIYLYRILEILFGRTLRPELRIFFSVCCSSGTWIILLATYISWMLIQKASVHTVRIKGKKFRIHERELRRLYALIVDLLSNDVSPEEIETLLGKSLMKA